MTITITKLLIKKDSESENVDKNYWVEEDEEEIEEELDDIDEEDYDGMDHSYNKITRTQEESYTFTDGKSEDSHKKLTKRQKNMMRINNNPEMIEEPLMSLPDKVYFTFIFIFFYYCYFFYYYY